jgi:hypothetical protein
MSEDPVEASFLRQNAKRFVCNLLLDFLIVRTTTGAPLSPERVCHKGGHLIEYDTVIKFLNIRSVESH